MMLSVISVKVVYLMIIFFCWWGKRWMRVWVCVSYRNVLEIIWIVFSLLLFKIFFCNVFVF